MPELIALGGLFTSALVAATLLPAQSEAVLATLVAGGKHPIALLVAVATVGNMAGACLNWLLGRGLARWQHRRWFPIGPAALERAHRAYARWGRWSLLFSWLPLVGDPLTVAAGALREPFWRFLLWMGAGKLARYLVVAWAASRFIPS